MSKGITKSTQVNVLGELVSAHMLFHMTIIHVTSHCSCTNSWVLGKCNYLWLMTFSFTIDQDTVTSLIVVRGDRFWTLSSIINRHYIFTDEHHLHAERPKRPKAIWLIAGLSSSFRKTHISYDQKVFFDGWTRFCRAVEFLNLSTWCGSTVKQ